MCIHMCVNVVSPISKLTSFDSVTRSTTGLATFRSVVSGVCVAIAICVSVGVVIAALPAEFAVHNLIVTVALRGPVSFSSEGDVDQCSDAFCPMWCIDAPVSGDLACAVRSFLGFGLALLWFRWGCVARDVACV